MTDDDEALALYLCYELSYRGFADVDDRWEWEPSLLSWRRELECRLVARLVDSLPSWSGGEVGVALQNIFATDDSPSLAAYLANCGTLRDLREFLIHRSAYQLKEADPHTWALPRLIGRAKAAMVRIQSDEYGCGHEEAMHAVLFARTLKAARLDHRYGAYLDALPGITLTAVNVMSLFGLHRRWRGALVGHLAGFEMSSVGPNLSYARAIRRLGLPDEAASFFDVHVTADTQHQRIALEDLARGLAGDEPSLVPDIVFGAASLALVEGLWARHCIDAWCQGRSSLRNVQP